MWRGVGATLLGAALFLGAAEVAVRWIHPRPRVQVIALDNPHLTVETWDGVLLWREPQLVDGKPVEVDLRGEDCERTPATLDVVIAGDSVFRVTDGPPDTLASQRAARILKERGHDVCVHDVSESAYLPYQQLAEARRAHARWGAEVVVFGVWKSAGRFAPLAEGLVADVSSMAATPSGLPVPPLPLGEGAHRALLSVSALWRYATLALAPGVAHDAAPAWVGAHRWAREQGIPASFLALAQMAAPLDSADSAFLASRRAPLAAAIAEDGGVWVDVAAHWLARGVDVEAVRVDLCCHLNARGHALLADLVVEVVEEALAGRPRGGADDGGATE